MIRRLVICLVVTMLSVPVPSTSSAASVWPSSSCTGDDPGGLGSTVPVLFVHGFGAGPGMWGAMAGDIGGISDARAFTFDYEDVNTHWVTDAKIGPALAERIDCLARWTSTGQVVIVAHSMGGLAARCAVDPGCNGGRRGVADQVGLVVTLGTPNTGTDSFSALREPGRETSPGGKKHKATGGLVLRLACLAYSETCRYTEPEIRLSAASLAMRSGSDELAGLPHLPSDIPLHALAARLTVSFPLFDSLIRPDPDDVGDGVVPVESALAEAPMPGVAAHTGAGSGSAALSCGEVSVLAGLNIIDTAKMICWHVTMADDARFIRAVRSAIDVYVTQPVEPGDVDWRDRSYDVTCSGVTATPFTAQLADGRAEVTLPNDGDVDVGIGGAIAVGALTHDGRTRKTVVVPITCAPHAASPNFFTVELHVFAVEPHRAVPRRLGVLTPPATGTPSDFGLAPRFTGEPLAISDGRIVTGVERWVGQDPHDAPSVHEVVEWTWDGRQFVPAVDAAPMVSIHDLALNHARSAVPVDVLADVRCPEPDQRTDGATAECEMVPHVPAEANYVLVRVTDARHGRADMIITNGYGCLAFPPWAIQLLEASGHCYSD